MPDRPDLRTAQPVQVRRTLRDLESLVLHHRRKERRVVVYQLALNLEHRGWVLPIADELQRIHDRNGGHLVAGGDGERELREGRVAEVDVGPQRREVSDEVERQRGPPTHGGVQHHEPVEGFHLGYRSHFSGATDAVTKAVLASGTPVHRRPVRRLDDDVEPRVASDIHRSHIDDHCRAVDRGVQPVVLHTGRHRACGSRRTGADGRQAHRLVADVIGRDGIGHDGRRRRRQSSLEGGLPGDAGAIRPLGEPVEVDVGEKPSGDHAVIVLGPPDHLDACAFGLGQMGLHRADAFAERGVHVHRHPRGDQAVVRPACLCAKRPRHDSCSGQRRRCRSAPQHRAAADPPFPRHDRSFRAQLGLAGRVLS